MCDLKHFDKYQIRLTNLANAMSIKVVYKSCPYEGAYVPSRQQIVLDTELSEAQEIAVFLHELGHAIDQLGFTSQQTSEFNASYGRIYTKKYKTKHLKVVLNYERRAWAIGVELAVKLKIQLGKWYYKERNQALRDYKKDTRKK